MTENEGLHISSKVQYVGQSINLYKHQHKYSGHMQILAKYLGREYLWQKIRVLGNAYGCHANIDMLSGNFTIVSYRDPHLTSTLKNYKGIPAFIESLAITNDEFEKLLIGTIGTIDSPRSPDQKGFTAYNRYRTNVKQEDIQRSRDQILSAKSSDIKAMSGLLKDFCTDGKICVIGSERKITDAKSLFNNIRPIFTKK